MLKNILVLPSFILILIINTSCTSMEYPKVYTEQLADDFQTMSYTADIRGTHVIKKNG